MLLSFLLTARCIAAQLGRHRHVHVIVRLQRCHRRHCANGDRRRRDDRRDDDNRHRDECEQQRAAHSHRFLLGDGFEGSFACK